MADLTHIDAEGNARMVDVGDKPETERIAIARASVIMQPDTLKLIQHKALKKGDVLAVAQLAGIGGNIDLLAVVDEVALRREFGIEARQVDPQIGLLDLVARPAFRVVIGDEAVHQPHVAKIDFADAGATAT